MQNILSFTLLLCVLSFAFYVPEGWAQRRVYRGLVISPPVMEIAAQKGQKLEGVIKLTNDYEDQKTRTWYVKVLDFTAGGDETGTPRLLEEPKPEREFSLASWVSFPKKEITVKFGETVRVPYVIEVPDEAEPGGHYAVIFFTDRPLKLEPGKIGVALVTRIGTLTLVTVEGEIRKEGKLVEFKSSKGWYEKPPVGFITRFENLGNIHLKPYGQIEIFDMLGKSEATLTVNQALGNVLPRSIRRFENSWVAEKKFFPKWGKYTARLTLNWEGKKVEETIFFWLVPWKFSLGCLGMVILLVFGIKRYNRWIIERAKKI